MKANDLPYNFPDATGHFGPYGGSFVSETLSFALDELRAAYAQSQHDQSFRRSFTASSSTLLAGPAPFITPNVGPSSSVARRSISSAKISITPAHTR
jgi:tryptophan synthase beta subunit